MRTLFVVEVEGDVYVPQVNTALAGIGLKLAGPTTGYRMHPLVAGHEHSYRPDEVCMFCGYPDPHDGLDDDGLCQSCQEDDVRRTLVSDGALGECKTCGQLCEAGEDFCGETCRVNHEPEDEHEPA